MVKRKVPFKKEEHEEFGKAIGEVTHILSPFVEKICKAYGVKSKQALLLQRSLNLLSSQLCSEMDNRWHAEFDDSFRSNPYYGPNKICWGKV